MDSENESHLLNVSSTPSRSAKGMFGLLKSSEKKKAATPKLAQPSFAEESVDALGESVISEVKPADSKALELGYSEVIPEENEEDVREEEIEEQQNQDQDAYSESVSEEGESPSDIERREQDENRRIEELTERVETLILDNMTLQRALETLVAQSQKERALQNEELAEQRKRAQKAEESGDAVRMELTKQRLKIQNELNAKINQLQSEIKQLKAVHNANGMASGKSFTSSFSSRWFSSGRSQNIQAKIQANATERDFARKLRMLEEQVERLKDENWRLQSERDEWREFCAQQASTINQQKEQNTKLYKKLGLYRDKILRDKVKMRKDKMATKEIVDKAGWAAEEVDRLLKQLEYEKLKHVKPSRLQQLKIVDELEALRKEVEVLRKYAPKEEAKPKKAAPTASASASSEAPKASTWTAPVVSLSSGAYGQGTLTELIALKAQQREQRKQMDPNYDPIKEAERLRQAAKETNAAPESDMAAAFRNVMNNRRVAMGGEEEDEEGSILDSDDEFA